MTDKQEIAKLVDSLKARHTINALEGKYGRSILSAENAEHKVVNFDYAIIDTASNKILLEYSEGKSCWSSVRDARLAADFNFDQDRIIYLDAMLLPDNGNQEKLHYFLTIPVISADIPSSGLTKNHKWLAIQDLKSPGFLLDPKIPIIINRLRGEGLLPEPEGGRVRQIYNSKSV